MAIALTITAAIISNGAAGNGRMDSKRPIQLCTAKAVCSRSVSPADSFVPPAAYEPMESLEN